MDIQKAAVIGHPIAHTMSPFIQKKLFETFLILINAFQHVIDMFWHCLCVALSHLYLDWIHRFLYKAVERVQL